MKTEAITLDHLREVLEEVANKHGREVARAIIHQFGEAQYLAHVPENRYADVFHIAKSFLRNEMVDGITRAARRLHSRYQALENLMGELMSAKDALRDAVDNAVTEMGKAGDFIKNHPPAQDDPELQSLADRLKAASSALAGVDVEQATDTGSTSGTTSSGTADTTGSGTVDSGGQTTQG